MNLPLRKLLWIVPIAWLSLIATVDVVADDGLQSKSSKKVSKDDVLEWLDQLDANKASLRAEAEKALIQAGVEALEYLPEKRSGFSVEAAERLARIRAALVALKAKEQAAAIKIRLDNAKTLGDALEAISRKSGVEFDHSANESLPIQASNAPLSFWHALDVVLDQASLDVNHYGGDQETIQLVPRSDERRSRVDSAAYAGVYRIEATSVTARRVFNASEQSGLNLSMEITWQPGMTPIGLTIPVGQIFGKLDDENSLQAQTSQETIEIVTNNELAFSEFFLPLELPVDRPSEIDSIGGTIESLLPGKQHLFEFELTQPGQETTVDAMTVQLEQVTKNGDLYEVRIGVDLENADRALESHRQWLFQNSVHVEDDAGVRCEQLGYELYRQTESGVGLAYFFDIERLDGAKLIYRSPTSVTKNKVDFLIQGIQLP